jgi:Anti-sigma-28 factor, FlgM
VRAIADTATMNVVAPVPTTRNRVAEIKRLVDLGEYRVDPRAVAEAMILRAEREIEATRRRRAGSSAQKACSYPDSSPPASVKLTPARPSTTPPIHVRGALAVGQAA